MDRSRPKPKAKLYKPGAENPATTPAMDEEIELALGEDEKLVALPTDEDHDEIIETDEDGAIAAAPGTEGQAVGPTHKRFVVQRDVQKRLDKYLGDRLKGASRNKIQQLIEMGGVRINDRATKNSYCVRAGDTIDVILPPRAVRQILPEPIPLKVIYEDEHFIVINKQANLIVHPARGNLSGTLVNGLAYHFQKTAQDAAEAAANAQKKEGEVAGLSTVGAHDFRPGIIHRLDKNTTGVMVVGKSDEAHWKIARQFEDRKTLKAYLAIVHGSMEGQGGVIDYPLGKHPTIREAFAVRFDPVAKDSVTIYRVRERYQGYTLVELELKTGRTHQIRVHLSYLGFPIIGDIVYGGEPIGTPELDTPVIPAAHRKMMSFARTREEGEKHEALAQKRKDLLLAHPALHATLLRITHPILEKEMTFTAAVHEPMASIIRELRKRPAEGPVAKEGFYVDLKQAVPD